MTLATLELVVIGTGRSGTAWAARHLTAAGVPCGHESVFDWHPSSDPGRRLDYPGRTPSPYEPAPDVVLRAESSLAAIAFLPLLPADCVVWHLTRDPLAVVASWAESGILDWPPATPYGQFMARHVPGLADEPTTIGRAARWVAEWNLRGVERCRVLGLAVARSRIEDHDADTVNPHRLDPDPLEWATIRDAASPAAVAALERWAYVAGYQ